MPPPIYNIVTRFRGFRGFSSKNADLDFLPSIEYRFGLQAKKEVLRKMARYPLRSKRKIKKNEAQIINLFV